MADGLMADLGSLRPKKHCCLQINPIVWQLINICQEFGSLWTQLSSCLICQALFRYYNNFFAWLAAQECEFESELDENESESKNSQLPASAGSIIISSRMHFCHGEWKMEVARKSSGKREKNEISHQPGAFWPRQQRGKKLVLACF